MSRFAKRNHQRASRITAEVLPVSEVLPTDAEVVATDGDNNEQSTDDAAATMMDEGTNATDGDVDASTVMEADAPDEGQSNKKRRLGRRKK